MTKEEFFSLLGEVDEQKISGAGLALTTTRNNHIAWIKWGAIAACLGLAVVMTYLFVNSPVKPVKAQLEAQSDVISLSQDYQVSLSKSTSGSESEDIIPVQLVSVKDGLCYADDIKNADGTVSREIYAFVAPDDDKQNDDNETMSIEEAREFAYLDLDSASDEMKEKILEARRVIIFSLSWVADGYTGYVTNVKTGEIIKTLPTFSELFPDWDMPVFSNSGDQITEDGFGSNCLYLLSMEIIAVNDDSIICYSRQKMNLFNTDTEITVYLPNNTSVDRLGLGVGDTVFVSFYGSECSISERYIKAKSIERKG